MGRKKIRIESIENERQKMVTFSRRRAGLIKKAHELAVLCDCKIALLIFDRTDNCHLFSSDQQAEELLKRYQERDDIQKRCMIDCLNEEDGTGGASDTVSEEADIIEESQVSPAKGRKKTTSTTNKTVSVISSPLPKQQPASGLLEYVVDQKGVGSESLVVKSATVGKNSGQASCTGGSRRNSLAGESAPLAKKQSNPANNYSPFNPDTAYPATPTTHSHQLFPYYPRSTLPTLETQFDFNLMGSTDMGLATLNANDFNLMGIWGNANTTQQQLRSYFDIVPQSHPQQQQQQQQMYSAPRYVMNQYPMASSATISQNPINNLVSDLFGDISSMF